MLNRKATTRLFFVIIFTCICLMFSSSQSEEMTSIPQCVNSVCFSNPTDIAVSHDGSFFLVVNSGDSPFLRKVSLLDGVITNDVTIPLAGNADASSVLMVSISNDNKKALVYGITAGSSNNDARVLKNKLYFQTEQGTACQCPLNTYFNGTLCVTGMLTCSDLSDAVCGCNNLNYLNSCTAQANGVKTFTKAACGTTATLSCSNDSQCPSGTCRNGNTFMNYTCTGAMCQLVQFSNEPCTSSSSSSSGSNSDCRCSSGAYFDGTNCVSGTLDCTEAVQDSVCSCDNLNFINSCVAMANGYKLFTKGTCGTVSNLSCSSDSQCPPGTCPKGENYNKYTCTNNKCVLASFSEEPCLNTASSSGGTSQQYVVVNVVDLTDNTVKSFIPIKSLNNDKQNVTAVSFFNDEGSKLLAGTDNSGVTQLIVINSATGDVENNFPLPGAAKSIEFAYSNFERGVITFKDTFAQSVGILNGRTKEITKLDTPDNIFFSVGEFLEHISFDRLGGKGVISSFDGRHVVHFLDLNEVKLTIVFLDKNKRIQGKTISRITSDGNTVISVGGVSQRGKMVVYKLDSTTLKHPTIVKKVTFNADGRISDVKITPDNSTVLILTVGSNGKNIRVLNLKDLSVSCNYSLSESTKDSHLSVDPYGRYFATTDPDKEEVSLITGLKSGIVFKDISPNSVPMSGGVLFSIDGFIDPDLFLNEKIKVCFDDPGICADSVQVLDDGMVITGVTPGFSEAGLKSVSISVKRKEELLDNSDAESISCPKKINNFIKVNKVFKVER